MPRSFSTGPPICSASRGLRIRRLPSPERGNQISTPPIDSPQVTSQPFQDRVKLRLPTRRGCTTVRSRRRRRNRSPHRVSLSISKLGCPVAPVSSSVGVGSGSGVAVGSGSGRGSRLRFGCGSRFGFGRGSRFGFWRGSRLRFGCGSRFGFGRGQQVRFLAWQSAQVRVWQQVRGSGVAVGSGSGVAIGAGVGTSAVGVLVGVGSRESPHAASTDKANKQANPIHAMLRTGPLRKPTVRKLVANVSSPCTALRRATPLS